LDRVIIIGAAGRDFHNFNVYFRNNSTYDVKAFTATQIPGIDDRKYPPTLSGDLYPEGIPIFPEEKLEELIRKFDITQVIYAMSDSSHEHVMHIGSRVIAAGADFRIMGPKTTMIKAKVPVVAVCAVRTGVGKSQTTRKIAQIMRDEGFRVVVVRHPMPYGDLSQQITQRFSELADLDKYATTIEEREEYEPHIVKGTIVYAGVDYGKVLRQAETDADVILWDGGNNDIPFFTPNIHITLVDPHRLGHETSYHPGEANLRMADIVIINKCGTAKPENVQQLESTVKRVNPKAKIVKAKSPITLDNPDLVKNKRVLVVEDGPTLTHGGMSYGAGTIAAKNGGVLEILDPRPYAVGSIKKVFQDNPHLNSLVPAMGYSDEQIDELEQTINSVPCDVVVIGTPIDLTRIAKIEKPTTRARYELVEAGSPTLKDILQPHMNTWKKKP
jgi:predicted GTPase